MGAVEYKGKILQDGHLSCPNEVKKRLHLTSGSAVKVAVSPLKEGKITKLKGIWQGVEISAEDIRAAREEMWGMLGRKRSHLRESKP
jgi:hypothetical protein